MGHCPGLPHIGQSWCDLLKNGCHMESKSRDRRLRTFWLFLKINGRSHSQGGEYNDEKILVGPAICSRTMFQNDDRIDTFQKTLTSAGESIGVGDRL